MKNTQVQIRCSEEEKARWEALAGSYDLSVSAWLRTLANGDFNPEPLTEVQGGELRNIEPLPKVTTAKKQGVGGTGTTTERGQKILRAEKIKQEGSKASIKDGSGSAKDQHDSTVIPRLKYTGETHTFNGVLMYEHETETGSKRWTKEPPKAKK